MRKHLVVLAAIGIAFLMGFLFASRSVPVQAKDKPGTGFAAIPAEMGTQDIFGGYEVVKDWPQNISTLPGNEKWTYGAGQSVYAENPNRIYMLFRGELPKMAPPKATLLP